MQAKVSDIEPQVLAKGYTGEQYKACITYAMPLQCTAGADILCAQGWHVLSVELTLRPLLSFRSEYEDINVWQSHAGKIRLIG
eukprot:COSAG02_NODE_1977_length_10205_cov_5.317633_3_plen_83_part_00